MHSPIEQQGGARDAQEEAVQIYAIEVACMSQALVGDILFGEHDWLPPGQLLLTQAPSLFELC
jgi:hypothetical protein